MPHVDFKQIKSSFSCPGTTDLGPSERNWQKHNFDLASLKAVLFCTITPQPCLCTMASLWKMVPHTRWDKKALGVLVVATWILFFCKCCERNIWRLLFSSITVLKDLCVSHGLQTGLDGRMAEGWVILIKEDQAGYGRNAKLSYPSNICFSYSMYSCSSCKSSVVGVRLQER